MQSIERSMRVLKKLARGGMGLSFGTLLEGMSVSSSTLHRTLASLQEAGFVKQESKGGKYFVGDELVLISLSLVEQIGLRGVAQSYLEDLKERTGETSNLVVLGLDKKEVVYVQQVSSDATVSGFSLIGRRAPVYATGVGKVFLANMDWLGVEQILEKSNLNKLTENTITNPSRLKYELEKVAKRGYAVDREECEEGAACIAAPVKNDEGKTIVTISISGPSSRLLGDSMPDLIQIVKYEAEKLSHDVNSSISERLKKFSV